MVRALAVWVVATLAAVGVAVEAFETVADDVTVRRDAPITRNEVRHRLQERARDATGSNQADEKGGAGAATPSTARVGPAEPDGPQTSTTHGQSSTTSNPPAQTGGAKPTDSGGNGGGRADAPAGASR